jgi:hypothetical protein
VLLLLDNHEKLEEGVGNCPVCRKPFHAKDLDHVIDLVGSHSFRVVSYLAPHSMNVKYKFDYSFSYYGLESDVRHSSNLVGFGFEIKLAV